MMAKPGRPLKIATPEEFDELAQAYFDACRDRGEPVLLTGLVDALGFCSRRSLYDYARKKQFAHSVQRALLRVEMDYEKSLRLGKSVSADTFVLKNFGWSDKSTIDVVSSDGSMSPGHSPAVVMEAMIRRRRKERGEM